MNITPNSFSDGKELNTPEKFLARLKSFGPVDSLDIGAESTAPMNAAISWEEEWGRIEKFLPCIKSSGVFLSLDTYHPETVFKFWQETKTPFIWNDVSGKIDEDVEKFLRLHENNRYVFCHNLAPTRELSGSHINYKSPKEGEEYLEELADYFLPHIKSQVIFDPCLGFSKTYEQNWFILENFGRLQEKVPHNEWLLGFSRKSFLRQKLGIAKMTEESKEELDHYHHEVIKLLVKDARHILWIRTHRPELILRG